MPATWDALQPEIDHWIESHEPELVDLVQQLVRYPSVSTGLHVGTRYPFGPACAQLADATRSIVEGYGLTWQNHDYYAVSATYGAPVPAAGAATAGARPRIAFYSHLDVVPARSTGWTHPPFEPHVEGGWIFGRGSTDNKGPFASVLFALRFLAEQGMQLRHDVSLFGGFDEEVGMDDAKWIAANLEPARYNLVSDCSFPVCVAEKGILEVWFSRRLDDPALLRLSAGEVANAIPDAALAEIAHRNADGDTSGEVERYETTGKAAHAAFPEGSVNALTALAAKLSRCASLRAETCEACAVLADLFAQHDGSSTGIGLHDDFLGDTTCVPTIARYENGVLRILANVRFPAIKPACWVRDTFARSLQEAGFEIEDVEESPARPVHEDDALVALLTNIVDNEVGRNLQPYAMGGATHARWIPGALGFGPGRQFDGAFPPGVGCGHEADEAVSISHLEQAIRIYVRAILELDARKA